MFPICYFDSHLNYARLNITNELVYDSVALATHFKDHSRDNIYVTVCKDARDFGLCRAVAILAIFIVGKYLVCVLK